MSYYVKPKFVIGQTIFSIKDDKIEQVEVESIQGSSEGIAYLSKNRVFLESQSFSTLEEAKDFFDKAVRIPFVNGNVAWEGDLTGVKRVKVVSTSCFFKDDLKKPYNITTRTDSCVDSTSIFETQIEATESALQQLKQFLKIKE